MFRDRKDAEQRLGKALDGYKGCDGIVLTILVDDGIAMGSTMRAAVELCRSKQAGRIVVAAPVASPATAAEFAAMADEAVILDKPPFFQAVAESYENWYDVPDSEVVLMMQKAKRSSASDRSDGSDPER